MTVYRIKYYDIDEPVVKAFEHDSEGFYTLSKAITFDDCGSGIEELNIWHDMKPVRYCGWAPRMKMSYKYEDTNELVFEGYYPEWDH